MVTLKVLCHCKESVSHTLPEVLIGEHPHRASRSSHLPKSPLNGIRGTDLGLKARIVYLKEAKQVFFIGKQVCNRPGVGMVPSPSKRSDGPLGLSNTRGILDGM